jgi:hypothetical protein
MTVFSEIGAYRFEDCLALDRIFRAGLERIDCACRELGCEPPRALLEGWRRGDERAAALVVAALSVPELRRLLAIAKRCGEKPHYANTPSSEARALENAKQFLLVHGPR